MQSIEYNYLPLSYILQKINNCLNMGVTRSLKIKNNYAFYSKLLQERKSIFSEIIEINKVGNNANILEKKELIKHKEIDANMLLIVDVKISNHNFFQFKLRYKEYVQQPFFRFDSDGETHRNKVKGIPFESQLITTPHFHKFNENGVEIAYKTDKLLDVNEVKALEDINLCIKHFFHESNIRFNEESFPEIKILSNSLGFSLQDKDPNSNIIFI